MNWQYLRFYAGQDILFGLLCSLILNTYDRNIFGMSILKAEEKFDSSIMMNVGFEIVDGKIENLGHLNCLLSDAVFKFKTKNLSSREKT